VQRVQQPQLCARDGAGRLARGGPAGRRAHVDHGRPPRGGRLLLGLRLVGGEGGRAGRLRRAALPPWRRETVVRRRQSADRVHARPVGCYMPWSSSSQRAAAYRCVHDKIEEEGRGGHCGVFVDL